VLGVRAHISWLLGIYALDVLLFLDVAPSDVLRTHVERWGVNIRDGILRGFITSGTEE